jgi:hypothetical protein
MLIRASRATAQKELAGASARLILSGTAQEDAPMIVKLTTSNKASVWVNLDQVVQISTIAAEAGYPATELIMTNGAAITVFEMPDDIAQSTRNG